MENLINYPEVQSGIVPFIVALAFALGFKSSKTPWASLGVISGFLVTALMINGFDFQPLNGTRKIILTGFISVCVAVFAEFYLHTRRLRLPVLALLGGLAILWIGWPVFMRLEGLDKWLVAVAGVFYLVWQITLLDSLEDEKQTTVSVLALGVGTGFTAILGASALYGQFAISIAVATGALLLVGLFLGIKAGVLLNYPAGLLLGLLGFATFLYADLPWFALILLALIPVATRIPISHNFPMWKKWLVLIGVTMTPAFLAIFSVWYFTEDSMY